MTEVVRVVAHFRDGRLLKGSTQDFLPNRPVFHLQTDGGKTTEIAVKTLKALFFVKALEGDAKRPRRPGFLANPVQTASGKKIAVRFQDGELLCGYALSYAPERAGFFMTPADVGGNTFRVYVVASAAAEVKTGAAADAMVASSPKAGPKT